MYQKRKVNSEKYPSDANEEHVLKSFNTQAIQGGWFPLIVQYDRLSVGERIRKMIQVLVLTTFDDCSITFLI